MNELQKVEYNGILVLTTQQIAEAYETSTDTVTKNFNRNKDRYVSGKHYISLEGAEKNAFVDRGQFDRGLKNAKILYLWTKKGAFLHAKSLNTDTAWEVYDRLVDDYFNKREEARGKIEQGIYVVKFIADDMRVSDSSRLFMYENYCKDVGIPTGFIPKYTDNGSRERCSATELLNRNGCDIKTAKFNQLMIATGYMELKERASSKGGTKEYKALTEKGLKYGMNLVSNKNQKECQPYYYADTFMELYNTVISQGG